MSESKVKQLAHGDGSAIAKYNRLTHGDISAWAILRNELIVLFFNDIPGALGLALRKLFYPAMFAKCGKGTVFGRGITLRHAHKIVLGSGCIIDDYATLDAKGENNQGIILRDKAYVGRNTILNCKGGDIIIGEQVNISSNCTVFSSNRLTIGMGCMIGAYTYLLSGGKYDTQDPTPFADQSGTCTSGPLDIGADCWFGTRVTVLDAANVGSGSVIGAGSVVNKPIPPKSVAVGVPARVISQVKR